MQPPVWRYFSTQGGLDLEQKGNIRRGNKRETEGYPMIRLVRDSMALASVGGLVWMVTLAAQLVG